MNLSILIEYVIAAICIDENNGLRLALGRSAILTWSIIHRGKCSIWNLLVFSCIWVTGTQMVELPVMSTSGRGPLSSRITKNQQRFTWTKPLPVLLSSFASPNSSVKFLSRDFKSISSDRVFKNRSMSGG